MTTPDIRPLSVTRTNVPATTSAPAAASAPAEPAPQDRAQISGPTEGRPEETGLIPRAGVRADRAEPGKPEYVPGQVLVKFRPGLGAQDVSSLSESMGLSTIRHFEIPEQMIESFGGELYQFKLRAGDTVEQAIERLSTQPGVAYAEPNYVVRLNDPPATQAAPEAQTPVSPQPGEVLPNDLDSRLWGMRNTGQDGGKAGVDIGAAKAWATQTGKPNGQGPLIAIIDTGIDYRHPDLAANAWNNPNEVAGDGQDNDNSGIADDMHGANMITKKGDPLDDQGHGSHCAGTIAGVGNNGLGVVGVNWSATVAGVKFLDANGSGSYADAVDAVLYATKIGARVTSNSWGGGGFSQALMDAFKSSPALHICAAGNESSDNDSSPSYPAGFKLPNILAVAAHDRNDRLASFSNYGANTVHVAAPGVDIYSAKPGGGYQEMSGTSMATPHVSGVAGLLLAQDPTLTNEQLIARITNTAVKSPAFEGKTISGGRVNVANALKDDKIPPAAPADFHVAEAGASGMTLGWTETGDDGMEGNASSFQVRYSDKPILAEPGPDGVTWEQATPITRGTPKAPGQAETLRVPLRPDDHEQTLYFGLKVSDGVGNSSPLVTASGTQKAAAIPFKDDFEGADDWTTQGGWGRIEVEGHGKVYTDSPGGPYPAKASTSITSKPIKLDTVKNPVLMFRDKHDLEPKFDYELVEISADGGKTWAELDKMTGNADWTDRTVDLKAYEGKTVQIRFRLTSDDSVQKDGIYLDDVQIAGDPIQ